MAAKPGMSDSTIAKLLLVALSFCWGLSWTAMRVALDEVSPWSMRLIGYSIGAATLLALKTLPVGTAYAVWTGIGAVGTAALGIYLFGEPATAARLASIGLIVAGIVGLKLVT